jgi:hypothetical protein
MLAMVIAVGIASHAHAQATNAPLSLFISGGGTVSPRTNGELLVVGQSYNMEASPHAGYWFDGWEPVNVFTQTIYVIDTNGNTVSTVSTTVAPLPIYTNQPSLDFTMQPVRVILDNPGFMTITEGQGWRANFEPISLNIQLGDSNVILSWATNFNGLTLQSSTNLSSPVWAPVALTPSVVNGQNVVTNPISGKQQFYRLSP